MKTRPMIIDQLSKVSHCLRKIFGGLEDNGDGVRTEEMLRADLGKAMGSADTVRSETERRGFKKLA